MDTSSSETAQGRLHPEVAGAVLMEGERVVSALSSMSDGRGPDVTDSIVLLTNSRVIHLPGSDSRRGTAFAAIDDIDAVEIVTEGQGKGGYVWAALAFLVATLLYFVIDSLPYRIVGTILTALMGVYLIGDQLTRGGTSALLFKAGQADLRCDLDGDGTSEEVLTFINGLFRLKSRNGPPGVSRSDRFAPR
jgi:hypothetical protein